MPPPPPPPPPPSYGGPPPPPSGGGYSDFPGYQTSAQASPQYAGFGARLGGMLLDGLLYGLVAAIFAIPGVILIMQAYDDCVSFNDEIFCPDGSPKAGLMAAGIALIAIGAIVVLVLYVRALGRTGQTWGRKIAGIKVVSRNDGQPLGVGAALGRTLFANFISGSICYLGYLWMLWDKDKQTWHDKVVSSIVVRA
jgi:uncharacterized RDD family membrane protein YckC